MNALELLVVALMVVVAVLVLVVERRSRPAPVPPVPFVTPVVRAGRLVLPMGPVDRCVCLRCQTFRAAQAEVQAAGAVFVQLGSDGVRA